MLCRLGSISVLIVIALILFPSVLWAEIPAEAEVVTKPGDSWRFHLFGNPDAPTELFRPPENHFRRREEDSRVQLNRSPMNTDNDPGALAASVSGSIHGLKFDDPNMWCRRNGFIDGDGRAVVHAPEFCVSGKSLSETDFTNLPGWVGKNKHLGRWRPTKKVMGATIGMAPMAGLNDLMDWAVSGNQYSNLLGSRMSVLNATYALTEPAVAAGHANAVKNASLQLLARYAAEESINLHANANPETRDMILKAYYSCLNRKMSHLQANVAGDDVGHIDDLIGMVADLPNLQFWVKAQSECMHGERINDGFINMYQLSLTNPSFNGSSGYEFGDDYNHLKATAELIPGGDSLMELVRGVSVTQEIRLTDYLFNQERLATWTGFSLDSLSDDFITNYLHSGRIDDKLFNFQTVKLMKKSFQNMFGDFVFASRPHCLISEISGSNLPGGLVDDLLGSVPLEDLGIDINEIEYCPPQFRTGAQEITIEKEPPLTGGDHFYRELTRRVYLTMHDNLRRMCEFHNGRYWNALGGIDVVGSFEDLPEQTDLDEHSTLDYANQDPSGAKNGDPWADGTLWTGMTVMSMQGFKITPATLQLLYSMFTREDVEKPVGGILGQLVESQIREILPIERKLDCDLLDASPDKASSIEKILEGHSQIGGDLSLTNYCPEIADVGAPCLAARVTERMRVAFFLSQRIALGQLLATLIKSEQEIRRLIDSGSDNFARKYALQLIHDQAGTDDLFIAYESNLEQARRFLELLYKRQAVYAGSSSGLSLGFSESKQMGDGSFSN